MVFKYIQRSPTPSTLIIQLKHCKSITCSAFTLILHKQYTNFSSKRSIIQPIQSIFSYILFWVGIDLLHSSCACNEVGKIFLRVSNDPYKIPNIPFVVFSDFFGLTTCVRNDLTKLFLRACNECGKLP